MTDRSIPEDEKISEKRRRLKARIQQIYEEMRTEREGYEALARANIEPFAIWPPDQSEAEKELRSLEDEIRALDRSRNE